MEMKELEYIVAASEHTSLTEAAQSLAISQSTLSRVIHRVCTSMGVELFRRGSKLELTPAGRRYVEIARSILAVRQQTYLMIRTRCGARTRTISIGMSPHIDADALYATYVPYLQVHPDVHIGFRELYSIEGVRLVLSGELNLSIGIADPGYAAMPELRFIPIQEVEYIIAISENNILAENGAATGTDPRISTRSLADFRDVPFIAPEQRGIGSRSHALRLFHEAGVEPLSLASTGYVRFAQLMAQNYNAFTFIPIDSASPGLGLRYFRSREQNVICKGFYLRASCEISPYLRDFMRMYAENMKKCYPLSARLHPSVFRIGEEENREEAGGSSAGGTDAPQRDSAVHIEGGKVRCLIPGRLNTSSPLRMNTA